jgi:uncharacterized membrane protein
MSGHRPWAPDLFAVVAAVGVFEAVYHAWSEKAFSTNTFAVHYAPFASFFGVPYWLFGVVWFPLVLIVGLWSTRLGRARLGTNLLVLLTVGNLFTVYLWYLDFIVVRAYTALYVALYVTNYVLTVIVVYENWSSDVVHGFAYGTVAGVVVGVLLGSIFGPFAVAVCGVGGGILGTMRNFFLPGEKTVARSGAESGSSGPPPGP